MAGELRPGGWDQQTSSSIATSTPSASYTYTSTGPSNTLYVHTERTVMLHSRALQGSHKSVLVRSQRPPPDHNYTAQLDEYNERLRRQHQTLAAVRQHACQALSQEVHPTEESETLALRAAVNSSLESQMEFFTQCMSKWTASHHHA